MKRQRVRKALILISFFLFPVTIFYLSPVLIIEGASQGIVVGSFMIFTLLFFSSLFFGRAFCGWVCPGAGLQEICFAVNNKPARGGKSNWIKYYIWVPWISIIILMAVKAGGLKKIDMFYQIPYGISVSHPHAYVVYYGLVGLIVVLSLTAGKRAFCHYVCWMAPFMIIGTKMRNFFKWPALHLETDKDKCINCETCSKNCTMSLDVNGMVQKGSMKNSECILCGECVDGCTQGAIRYSFQI